MTDLTHIEERLAHLARAVEDLSDVVARQEREIARLSARVALLVEREADREADRGQVTLDDERPPHW
jgi:SlyX protein